MSPRCRVAVGQMARKSSGGRTGTDGDPHIAQQPKCPIQKGLTLKTEKLRGCSVIPVWHLPWGGGACDWQGPETRSFASLQCAGTGPNPRSLSIATLDWPLYVLIWFSRGSLLGASPGRGAFPGAQGPLRLLSPCCSVHRFQRCYSQSLPGSPLRLLLINRVEKETAPFSPDVLVQGTGGLYVRP